MNERNDFSKWMNSKGACADASEWVGKRTAKKAWSECKRGDWMLWALGRTAVDKRLLVKIACDVALSVLPLSDDPRVAAAIDAAEGWCARETTAEECRTAAREARNAAYAAAYAYAAASASASAAASAASAASAAASASAYASADAYASAYAAAAAYAYAADDAAADAYREIADLIRERISAAEFAALVAK